MEIFINHYNQPFPIPEPAATGLIICALLVFAILISVRRSRQTSALLNVSQTDMLRGLAILCIIVKHIDDFLIQGPKCFPLYLATYGGSLFFFLSGYGLMRSFSLKKNDVLHFAVTRIRRVFIPYWITAAVVLCLDYVLLAKGYAFRNVVLTVLGINIDQTSLFINGPAWFITMLLFLYCVFIVSTLFRNTFLQLLFIFFSPALFFFFGIQSGILNRIVDGFILMSFSHYMFMFPIGCLIACFYDTCKNFADYLTATRLRSLAVCVLLGALFIVTRGLQLKYHTHPNPFFFLAAFNLHCIIQIALAVFVVNLLASYNLTSGFLALVGSLSYELFLLHWPFMVKYDFVLFRMPLKFSFIIYFALLLLLAYVLRRVSASLARMRFS